MNLHAIASSVIRSVNPMTAARVFVSIGYDTADSGRQMPRYAPAVTMQVQIQQLTSSEIQHLDAMNIQGVKNSIYFTGELNGVVRSERKGGDIIVTPDDRIWLVVSVFEQWPQWGKVGVTLQDVAIADAYKLDFSDPRNSGYVTLVLGSRPR